jgi:Tfp pilus assembly protein PilX/roadblock/LC7 domain-containing protein
VTASNSLFFRRSRLRGLLSRAVADQRGISLILALLTLVVLGTLGTSVTVYATGHLHSSYTDQSAMNSYQLAEAGLNDAVSVLSQLSQDPDSNFKSLTTLPAATVAYPKFNGTATYSGTASSQIVNNVTVIVWQLRSTGVAGNPPQAHSRTLQQSVTVRGVNEGADGSSWSRFYQDALTPCLTINNDTFVTNVATRGDLCIENMGAITGASTTVDVGGNVTITGPSVTSSAHLPSGGVGWTNPTYVYTNNSQYATNAIAGGATGANQDTTGFGFAISPGAQILGISVSVERMASAKTTAVQTITETGTVTGGTFKLNATPPGGSATPTVALGYHATATQVQAALLTVYGSGNVGCSGGSLPTAVVCTFQGSDAARYVAPMTINSNNLTGSSSPTPVVTNTTTGGSLQDSNVQLLKAGSPVGTNEASPTSWPTSAGVAAYGSTSDLWGTTWTAADLNAGTFGLRFAAKSVANASITGSIDYISITVKYNDDTNGIGTSSVSVAQANVGGTCTYNGGAAHNPCSSVDHVYAGSITDTSAEGTLQMPQVDYDYWWANAMPGPKHFCTNANPGLLTNFFDNNASTTTKPDGSITVNGEMAPPGSSYTCQVWSVPPTGGTLLGELSWNASTHVLKIKGTVFVDGNFRFDDDGEVVNYSGRGTLMSSKDDEIDAVVCAGWTNMETGATAPTTDATSCLTHMSTWNSTSNMMVLMSEEPNEYDQGGSTCSGSPYTCYDGHPPGAFQGILYSTSECEIHQQFQDSGPVICNTINLPDEGGVNPTFFTFPSTGNLTDGQKYSDIVTATHFELAPGPQAG